MMVDHVNGFFSEKGLPEKGFTINDW